jgi:single-stranded DNA-binding protein
MNLWRAGCAETRTSGSEGGLRKRTGRKTDTAPQPDPYVWRQLAEHVTESLTKGSRVVVLGRLQQRAWTAEDGSGRSTLEVVAEELGPSLRWATATTRTTRSQDR